MTTWWNAQTAGPYPWQLTLFQGIAAIVIGILLLTTPAQTVFLLVQLLGIYWLAYGAFSLASIVGDSRMWGWKLVLGFLGIAAGILILQHPVVSLFALPAALVWVLGLNGIVMGCIGLLNAFQGGGIGAGILGVLSIVLGIALMTAPFIASFALPFVLGVLAIVGGIAAVFTANREHGAAEVQQPEEFPEQPRQAA